ncbi:hypothetical protein [Streptomyces sp. C184]|uniref:hypothetical protein n=1 Tax=Streptomyces sp. C184 TaxID=3237121 RepID=UPI0034C67E77
MDAKLVGRRVVVDPAIYDSEGPDANPVGLMDARDLLHPRSPERLGEPLRSA